MLVSTTTHRSENLRLGLEDLRADLSPTRRADDLGRPALLFFGDVRRRARFARKHRLAGNASKMVTACPHEGRTSLITQVGKLGADLALVLFHDDAHPTGQRHQARLIDRARNGHFSRRPCSGG